MQHEQVSIYNLKMPTDKWDKNIVLEDVLLPPLSSTKT